MTKIPVTLTHNGAERAAFADPGQNLLDFIRRGLGDLSPKYGCGQGSCGACTVTIDGETRLACLTLAETVEGCDVRTAAGLGQGATLDPLQQAFMDHFAAQCGYCTPGMLVSARALLDRNPNPTREEVVEAISGNLCRCTGYDPIIDAILSLAGRKASA
ncbi:(2Fe-2S)-binding protein [Jannaschia aquimarina]|uniref:NdhS_3 protein n=1 Tax=Jannaschia aquimarina TaxID=935700 RepID=A0A0D1CN95_9RHOB|nr:(2Fe-2S)-binding protein [Jannaschia aquimarina]KIT16227.1 Nicotinate dehydrogenase small FeS subunit [Jannaschia aquimarina]SNT15765.1 carbon-monoxide dehydrogenase small subunit [Jannaschia aquimarina]